MKLRSSWQIAGAVLAGCSLPAAPLRAQNGQTANAFLDFVRAEAAALRAADQPPDALSDWSRQRDVLRRNLLRAWGGFPVTACTLEAVKLGEFQREGYRVERIVFQTRPGIWMTANAYVPDLSGKLPAVLVVHGHWPGAKQDPVVQARCIGLAKQGFFVLAVDAFGAGERGVGRALGEYHGDMTAATLLPVGLPLSGLQVYENMRAVDYLLTRVEVDGARIGVTGASGGGNQTMYVAAWDERFAAAVPVCSVGNYQAYLGAGCCLCEVVPGTLQFTEEWGVLGMMAPRALMVINATKDSVQFSVREAEKSLLFVRRIFDLYGRSGNLEHATFQSRHDYSRPMRETMYGWMTRHLKGEGDGSLLLEPEITTENPETLRCFPGDSRPEDFVTIPRFAAGEAQKLLARITVPRDAREWRAQRDALKRGFAESIQGTSGVSVGRVRVLRNVAEGSDGTIEFQPEPRITLSARRESLSAESTRLAVLLDLNGGEAAAETKFADELRRASWSLVTLDLRATGKLAFRHNFAHISPDHHSAEAGLWLGRPLMGQWVMDVRGLLDALDKADGGLPRDIALIGLGPAGLVAMYAGALDERVTQVAAVGALASYVTDLPYRNQWLGLMVPGVLRNAGDIPQLAALVAPRELLIAGAVRGDGRTLASAGLEAQFEYTRDAYAIEQARSALTIVPSANPRELVARLQ